MAGAHRTLQHGHLQCGHRIAGVVISEGRLKVVVVVLQAGTRMRACLSPAARTGQPPWRRLRAGHRSTTGRRVRSITKPPPVLSIRPELVSVVPGHVDDQVAGYATNYEVNAEKNFTFITVRCNGVLVAAPGYCL